MFTVAAETKISSSNFETVFSTKESVTQHRRNSYVIYDLDIDLWWMPLAVIMQML